MEILASLINNKGITMHYTFGAPKHILYADCPGFTVILECKDKRIVFPFYLGDGEPEIDMVISCLLIRAEVLNFSYERYCQECDYEPSEITKVLFQQDLKIGEITKDFLGDDFEVFQNNNDY